TAANETARLRLLLLWARARGNSGQPEQATALFVEADALARQLGDRLGVGAALSGLASLRLDKGELLAATLLLENAHRELDEPAGNGHELRARALAADAHALHSRILLYLGAPGDGLRHLQTALQFLPLDDVDLRCHFKIDLARLQALAHHYPTALQ